MKPRFGFPQRSGKRAGAKRAYFFDTTFLAATAAFFFATTAVALVCFWVDFLPTAFGDLSPIIFGLVTMFQPTA